MRVIVTGSRKWSDPMLVCRELTKLYVEQGPFEIVHGACPTGADAAAEHWLQAAGLGLGCTEQRYVASWATRGKAAGPERNARMVEAGADLVLAFPLPGGSGTQHTMSLARAAGIEVRVVDHA